MNKVLLLLIVTVLLSCKSDPNNTTINENIATETIPEIEKSKTLVLEIDLEMSVSEDIKLMSLDTFLNNGQFADVYITQKLNANETSKNIRFELPENITPDNLVGISFGAKSIKEITIKSIKLSYGDLNYDIKPEAILDFFYTNDFIAFDDTSKTFKTKEVKGKHNPILFLRKLYLDKIQGIK